MKRIKLKEEQLRLFTKLIKEEDAPNFDNGDVKDYGDEGESGKIAPENVADVDDNLHNGSAVKQLGSMERMCPQNWWANGMQGWRRMP
jgi:hypothetical protein